MATLDTKIDMLEGYVERVVPDRVRRGEFEAVPGRYFSSMKQEIKLVQQARTTRELADLKGKLAL